MYTPDRWKVIKINGEQPHYRVFATWLGGYLNGDEWRMNSGITKVTEEGDYYLFEGSSGSVYKCHKDNQGTSGYTAGVLGGYVNKQPGLIEVLDESVDVTKLEYK